MGKFVIQGQWENQEQDGRPLSRGHITHARNMRMEKTEKNGGVC